MEGEELYIPSLLDKVKKYWITSFEINKNDESIGFICNYYSLTKSYEYTQKNNIKNDKEVNEFLNKITIELENKKKDISPNDEFKKKYIEYIKKEFIKSYSTELNIECDFSIIIEYFFNIILIIDSYISFFDNDNFITDEILILKEYSNWKMKQLLEFNKNNNDFNKRPTGSNGFKNDLPLWILNFTYNEISQQQLQQLQQQHQSNDYNINVNNNQSYNNNIPIKLKSDSIKLARKILSSLQSTEYDKESALIFTNQLFELLKSI